MQDFWSWDLLACRWSSFAISSHHSIAFSWRRRPAIWRYQWNCSISGLCRARSCHPYLGFIQGSFASLEDPTLSFVSQFHSPSFHFHPSLRSISRHRAPFQSLPLSVPSMPLSKKEQNCGDRGCSNFPASEERNWNTLSISPPIWMPNGKIPGSMLVIISLLFQSESQV